MKAFRYNNEIYLRAVPGKQLFRSTLVHEVVNRGDIFAIRVSDQLLTIIPGTATVEHLEVTVNVPMQTQSVLGIIELTDEEKSVMRKENARAKLRAIRLKLVNGITIAEATRQAAIEEPDLFAGELE